MFGKQNHSTDNQQAVLGSQVVARAVCRRSNGQYDMIVVFAQSTRLEFYWTFRVRSPRSPRRSWKFTGYQPRDPKSFYSDFGSFVSHYATLHSAEVISTRMPQKRRLASLGTRTEKESIHTDWNPRDEATVVQDRMYQKNQNGRKGKGAWLWR